MSMIEMDSRDMESWIEYLDEFLELVGPLATRRGISVDALLIVFELNKLQHKIDALAVAINGGNDSSSGDFPS